MVIMNQRFEPRLETDQSVWVTLFGEPDIRLPARVKNVSTRGIGLELEGPVAIGSPVKIELDDCLFLGEVIYCRQDETSFFVGVELEQALYGLSELARALGAFPDSSSSPEQTDPVIERRYQN
jgi:PilZ domain-containing protein